MAKIKRVQAIGGKRVVVRVGDDIRDYYDMEVTTVDAPGAAPTTAILRLSLAQATLLRMGLEQTVLPAPDRHIVVTEPGNGVH